MKASTPIKKHHGRYLPWAAGSAAFLGLAGTLFALSEVLESDSDGDGIADYLEFLDVTDPLDPNNPPQARGASVAYSVAATVNEATGSGDDSSRIRVRRFFRLLRR